MDYTALYSDNDDDERNDLLLPNGLSSKGKAPTSSFSSGFTLRNCSAWAKRNKVILIVVAVVIICIIAVTVIPVVILHYKPIQVLSDNCSTDGARLVSVALEGTMAFSKLSTMCISFGNRLSGSSSLEQAITWIQEQMTADGLDNVQTQPVMVTHWVRGNEYASIQLPYTKKMNILGLGGSVNTSSNGITADAIVVSSFEDLTINYPNCTGKIVVFNAPFTNYSATVSYRSGGASAAAACGAIAALVRSVTPFSLGTPHTGTLHYDEAHPKIPCAAITLEDADLLQGIFNMNKTIQINLYMEAQTMPQLAASRNVMGEVTGSDLPEQVVVIGGHVDSWDVGQGAVDDGVGIMVAWEAVRLIKSLGITPRRTIRVVGWTNEENGAAGGQAYAESHLNETFFSIETDNGATQPLGFAVQGASSATMRALQKLSDEVLMDLGANNITTGDSGEDNSFLIVPNKIPGANMVVNMTQYFWYHHSEGDAIDKVNPKEMDQCVATLASMALCIANFNGDLPS
ncbi:hypothetical protein SAMD00019534_115910 [Acytostelium subglobosum LB1]|uniref:hypothetical protein n=1 Tax=Acytostelium subglobosum LB1 TaxID=1410327 RepID=UPI000644C1F7|nr:hypothetical protein SAMD00019534_115910 [Acytostelium subglobosum LB1]GAM28415.1 hypothetical protein SAMD00019534_115910 [Acytostelium subglobosum LB1]|eukprot:XP_012748732.1 hypothetical protein SAMD00019534_115910 [Acytostelium subglobosum LB1]